MGSVLCIHQVPQVCDSHALHRSGALGAPPRAKRKQWFLSLADRFQIYCSFGASAQQAPGPKLESCDPRGPLLFRAVLSLHLPHLTGDGPKEAGDVPRATQQILDSEPGQTPSPPPFPSPALTFFWLRALAAGYWKAGPGPQFTNRAPRCAKRALPGCQAEAEALGAGQRLPSQETPSGSSWYPTKQEQTTSSPVSRHCCLQGPPPGSRANVSRGPALPGTSWGFLFVWTGPEDVPSRGTDAERRAPQAGAHRSLPSTPFPWETPKVWP